MKNSIIMMTLMATFTIGANASEKTDTLQASKGRTVIVTDSLGQVNVRVLNRLGDDLQKLNETSFSDEQEVNRVYVTSPFLPSSWKDISTTHRRAPKFKGHLPLFTYGWRYLCDNPFSYSSPDGMPLKNSKSYEIGIGFANFAVPFNRQHTIGAVVGLMWSYTRHHFQPDYALTTTEGTTNFFKISDTDKPVKNSYISYHSIRVPVVLELHPVHNYRNAFIGAGLSFEFRGKEHSHYKTKHDTMTPTHDININPVGLNFEGYMGWESFIFRMSTGLTPLLKSDAAPKVYTCSFGVAISL